MFSTPCESQKATKTWGLDGLQPNKKTSIFFFFLQKVHRTVAKIRFLYNEVRVETKSGNFAYCASLEKVSLVMGRREACVDGWIPQCLGSNPISTNVNQSRCLSQHFPLSLFQVQKIWKVSKVRSCAKKVFAVLKNLQCLAHFNLIKDKNCAFSTVLIIDRQRHLSTAAVFCCKRWGSQDNDFWSQEFWREKMCFVGKVRV